MILNADASRGMATPIDPKTGQKNLNRYDTGVGKALRKNPKRNNTPYIKATNLTVFIGELRVIQNDATIIFFIITYMEQIRIYLITIFVVAKN